jgi:hypothetical protein
MLQHRAAVEQQLVQQEADGLRRLSLDREQVLNRLWEIANLSPEMTRGSITGQVKAISMIVAMQNFIPDPRAASSLEKKSPLAPAQSDTAACLSRLSRHAVEHAVERQQQATTPATTNDPQPSPAPHQQEDSPAVPARPACPGVPRSVPWKPEVAPGQSSFANRFTPSEAPKPYVPLFGSVPDLGVPFSIKNPFVHPR